MDLVMEPIERGLVPDPLVRVGIRQLLSRKLAVERRGGPDERLRRRSELLRVLRQSPLALATETANRQHYELPPEFFQRVLGPRLKYSCALWEPGTTELDRAENAMLALTAQRAGLADGQRILELGCGWGSLTLWIAECYPNARVVAVSNSAAQRRYIERAAAERGLCNLAVITADLNDFSSEGGFDRIVSVEMFEHMRNWPELLRRIRSWLRPDGQVFVHHFCHREFAYFFEVDGRSDWMARYFFTGGMMPSFDLFRSFPQDFAISEQWAVNGFHYEKTCRAWLERLDSNRPSIMPILLEVYGRDAARWFERWRVFFLACAELFAYGGGTEWLVGHYRLRPVHGG